MGYNVMTVEEALKTMKGKTNDKGEVIVNRFNKKNFNLLMVALANDTNFTSKVTKIKKGEVVVEDVLVTKGFRKWCKKLVEKMGVDKAESSKLLSNDFVIDNMDGLYEFFTEAMYLYMEDGNKFDIPSKEGFQGSLFLKDVPEKKTVAEARNPQTKEVIGTFERTKKKHKELRCKSTCPSYLSSKRKV